MNTISKLTISSLLFAVACGGSTSSGQGATESGGDGKAGDANEVAASAGDPAAVFGPLEVGADYASYKKLSKAPFKSKDHGNRFVEIYVNQIGADAYADDNAEFPVGTVIVKTSAEDQEGTLPGPIFVMEKRAAGFDDEHENWWYAMHWENPSPEWQKRLNAEKVYWRSPSKKVGYCWDCHENYPREVGLPPKASRAW